MMHPILGGLEYDLVWRRTYEYRLFGRIFPITLVVPSDEGDEIEPAQVEAFRRFERIKDQTGDLVTSAIFDHYLGIVDERRAMAGDKLADEIAPFITEPSQLASLVTPTELLIQETFGSNRRVVGLLFDCRWDPSLGLAVKFVDETIEEVGPQDIVL
ncbi:MAG: hypothetical protein JSR98_07075 [Proteobacteria bacterium]|nr:hypothetical protein [Pseudomonadota bacterium]